MNPDKMWQLLLLGVSLVALSAQKSADPSHWPGHLKPLGTGNYLLPMATVDEAISAPLFFLKYVFPPVPVLMKGVYKNSQAYKHWDDDVYLKNFSESSEFMITVEQNKKENRSDPAFALSFSEFLDAYRTNDIYMVSGVPPFLRQDLPLLQPLQCQAIIDELVDTVMWFSSGGTKSVLHHDDVNNINCLLAGRKEVLMANWTEYRNTIELKKDGGYSPVDVERVDFTQFPELHRVKFYMAEMEAGDCLFIPHRWFHQVNSFGRNIAVNVWWKQSGKLKTKIGSCSQPVGDLTLADVDFSSDTAYAEDNSLVGMLLKMMSGNKALSFQEFEEGIKNDKDFVSLHTWTTECSRLATELFEQLDLDKDGEVTIQDLENLEKVSDDVLVAIDEIGYAFSDIIEEQDLGVDYGDLAYEDLEEGHQGPEEEAGEDFWDEPDDGLWKDEL